MSARTIVALSVIFLTACGRNQNKFDASGTFEADEVIVSASATGKILSLDIDEGSTIAKDSIVGLVDPTDLSLQKEQVQASIDNHLATLYPLPVSEINAALVAPILARIEHRAPLMFEKVRARLHRILDHRLRNRDPHRPVHVPNHRPEACPPPETEKSRPRPASGSG